MNHIEGREGEGRRGEGRGGEGRGGKGRGGEAAAAAVDDIGLTCTCELRWCEICRTCEAYQQFHIRRVPVVTIRE